MAIDSTAELLFNIGANTDDAESNIQRFRTLLSKDLDDIGTEFQDWSDKILGELTTIQGAMTASAAILAAGIMAVGAAVSKANEEYDQYVDAVSRGMKVTGLHAEQMSTMYLLAEKTGTSYDTLVSGLTKFSSLIVRASQGNAQAQQTFKNLGISQDEVIAGQKDLWPVLQKTMDWFHNNSSAVQKAAEAKAAFSRDPALIAFLSKGAEGLEAMAKKGTALGLVLSQQDVVAALEFKAASKALREEEDAVDVAIGKATASARIWWATVKIGIFDTLKDLAEGKSLAPGTNVVDSFFRSIAINAAVAKAEIEKEIQAANAAGKLDSGALTGVPEPAKIKEATADFYGLTNILQTVQERIAATQGEEAKAAEEMSHLRFEVQKATEEYQKHIKAGDLTAESAEREAASLKALSSAIDALAADRKAKLAQMQQDATVALEERLAKEQEQTAEAREKAWNLEIDKLRQQYAEKKELTTTNEALIAQIRKAGLDKIQRDADAAAAQATTTLKERLAKEQQQTVETQEQAWNQEMDALVQKYAKERQLTATNEALIAQLRKAGLDKIARDRAEAFSQEVEKLQQHLEQINKEWQTDEQKIQAQYQVDVQKYTQAEEQKVVAATQGEQKRAEIHQLYAAIRTALYTKEQQDLQKLLNSQGWQGIFGSHFASQIKGDEELLRGWETSSNQALLSVRVAFEALKEMADDALKSIAQGMGQGIVHAFMYKQSVGEAMREAAASTIESLASQAAVDAIYYTGEGFALLATGNVGAAGNAFTAAAIFGSVGAAAAVTGRAIAPPSSTAANSSGSTTSSTSADTTSTSSSSASTGPTVFVHINGPVIGPSGAAQLCDIINQAVYSNDVTLYASHTKTGVPLT
jgi:hypothetical protein